VFAVVQPEPAVWRGTLGGQHHRLGHVVGNSVCHGFFGGLGRVRTERKKTARGFTDCVCCRLSDNANITQGAAMNAATVYDFEAARIDGSLMKLSDCRGKVLLIVNTASACGFTPQFSGLQTLHDTYANRGLVLLGFPCNQFGAQDPGSNAEIGAFCQKNYGVAFDMMAKIDVNGSQSHPLFQWLKQQAPGLLGSEGIKWNFTKFLVGRDGQVIKRYASLDKPASLAADIEQALSQA
jgi:glutathione peroxidase